MGWDRLRSSGASEVLIDAPSGLDPNGAAASRSRLRRVSREVALKVTASVGGGGGVTSELGARAERKLEQEQRQLWSPEVVTAFEDLIEKMESESEKFETLQLSTLFANRQRALWRQNPKAFSVLGATFLARNEPVMATNVLLKGLQAIGHRVDARGSVALGNARRRLRRSKLSARGSNTNAAYLRRQDDEDQRLSHTLYVSMSQQLGLALVRSGSPRMAIEVVTPLHEEHDLCDEGTLCLLGYVRPRREYRTFPFFSVKITEFSTIKLLIKY